MTPPRPPSSVVQPEVHPCPHCETPVEGPEGTFCCHGCELAHAIVSEAGLDAWYARREQPAPRSRRADGVAWDALPQLRQADGTVEVTLQVDGLRCASCVWVAERVLERTDGVADAGVSYASGRARLRFDPERVSVADLAGRIATLGYTPRPAGVDGHDDRDLLMRLGVAAFAAANVMGLSAALYTGWADGMDPRFAQLFRWLSLVLATPIVTWSAAPFFAGAWRGLRAGVLHMDLPIAIAVGATYAHGLAATLLHLDGYLDSLGMLVALLLAGRVLEARGRKRTADAAASLAALAPTTARRVVGEGLETVPTAELAVGDRIELGSGDEIPADGVVVSGGGEVRMALLTGESTPVAVAAGDRLIAGAVVDHGALRMGVTRVGEHTTLGRMARDLEQAADAPRQPSAADRLAPAFTAATLGVAGGTALVLAALGMPDEALARTVAVLVVACPCALALARPLVGAAGLGALARRGLLVRGADVLDRLAEVDVVVLDKTGTVTEGQPRVVEADDEVLRVAAGLERYSRHPIAQAILDEAVRRGLPIPASEDVEETAGVGLTGRVDGRSWSLRAGGPDRVALHDDAGLVRFVRLEDQAREHARDDVARLAADGREVVLLTGDHEVVARRVGEAVGVRRVAAGVDPAGKKAFVEGLQAAGRRVLFVGDGLNDGPALAAAHVGIAMGAGAASSVLAADGVLVSGRLGPLATGIEAARLVSARVRLNLVRSAGYNVLAVAGAVVGWVNPLVAAVLMPLSSGLVLASAGGVERAVARREESNP